MNNKHKLKRIKWGTLITISCLIGIILLNTNAKSLSNSKAKVKKLAEETNKCEVLKVDRFNPEIKVTTINDGSKLKVAVNIKKDSDKANFWLFISDGPDKNGNINYKVAGEFKSSYDQEFSTEPPLAKSYVVVVYKDGVANSCGTTDKSTAQNIANDYITNEGKFTNKMKNTIKDNYYVASGLYKIIEISDDQDIDTIDTEDDEKTKQAQEAADKLAESDEAVSGDYNSMTKEGKVDNTNLGTLQCSLNNVYKEGENYYSNSNTYYYEETKLNAKKNCETTCKETITVQYGPPVATKAGMCFEYKVKVQSKVACKSTWKGGSKPTRPKLCNVYPVCNSSKNFFDQAGPDEEFDSCINNCDNGKYSQKCINKCYKEVYENVNNKKISYGNVENDYSSKLLANKEDALPGLKLTIDSAFCSSKSTNNPKDNATNYNALLKAMQSYDNGCEYKYNSKTKRITWSCAAGVDNSKNWKSLGRYYFYNDNKAVQTLRSIATTCGGEPRTNGHFTYYIDKEGFKRATFGNTHCDESCKWVASSKTGTPGKDCIVSKSERDSAYQAALADYTNEKKECMAKASCSTETATFTISAKNKVAKNYKDGKVSETADVTSNFDAQVKEKSLLHSNGDPIIDRGGCYGSSSGDYNYMTEWAFPGSWRNNKNGTISQTKPIDDNGWSERKNYYCTSLDSVGVNSNWWNWAQYKKLKDKTNYEDSSIKYNGTSDSIKYNITATTNNFGHFGWNVTMQCFYATPSDETTTPPPSECEGEDGCGTETPKFEYEARSVDTKEMFPEESRGSGDEQIIGFNWTDKANENLEVDTNEKVTIDGKKQQPISYEIKPDALKEDIKKQAEAGKTYSDENLEYYVQLNRKALNELKKMKIGEFDGTFKSYAVGKEGVKVYTIQRYKTKLIDNYGGTRKRNKLCNNWDNGSCRTYS